MQRAVFLEPTIYSVDPFRPTDNNNKIAPLRSFFTAIVKTSHLSYILHWDNSISQCTCYLLVLRLCRDYDTDLLLRMVATTDTKILCDTRNHRALPLRCYATSVRPLARRGSRAGRAGGCGFGRSGCNSIENKKNDDTHPTLPNNMDNVFRIPAKGSTV